MALLPQGIKEKVAKSNLVIIKNFNDSKDTIEKVEGQHIESETTDKSCIW